MLRNQFCSAILVCLMIVLCSDQDTLVAQDTVTISEYSGSSVQFQDLCQIYEDTTRSLSISEILGQEFSNYSINKKRAKKYSRANNYWIKFHLYNDLAVDTSFYFFLRNNQTSRIYQFENGNLLHEAEFGLTLPRQQWGSKYSPKYYPINIEAGSEKMIIAVRTRDAVFSSPDPTPLLISSEEYDHRMSNILETNFSLYRFWYLFLGVFLFLFLFTLVQYFQHKEIAFLFYSLYILSILLYYSDYAERFDRFEFLFTYLNLPNCICYLTSYFIMLFYLLFVEKFLQFKKHTPRFYKFYNLQYYPIAIVFCIHVTMFSFNYDAALQNKIYTDFRVLMNIPQIINIALIAYLYRNKMGLFIVCGSLLLFVGVTASLIFFNADGLFESDLLNNSIVFGQFGMLAECFFFSSILGYRQKMIQDEKAKTQEQLINELQKNNELSNQLNNKLQVEVDKQSKIIVQQTEAKISAEYNEKLTNLKSKMLRSRMNPHFIFNSLNSIDNFVLNNRSAEASDYLTKFSKLMRNTLDYSKRAKVTLHEEIENLKLYVHMEQLRFNDKFSFDIISAQDVDLDKCVLPPLTLQPFVENAIWHGILHLDHPGEIKLFIEKKDGTYLIKIDDNGIGRSRAKKNKSLSATKNKSYGMKITEERLKFDKDGSAKTKKIEIIDKIDESGSPSGTTIILRIPIKIDL